jgi:DNA recombination protein RmuC
METLLLASTFVIGTGLGAFIACLLFRAKYAALQAQFQAVEQDRHEKDQRLQRTEAELRDVLDVKARAEQEAKRVPELERQLSELKEERTRLAAEVAELKKEREADKEKIQWIEVASERLRDTFQSLATQALQSNADEFLKRAREQLNTLLTQVQTSWHTHKAEMKLMIEPLQEHVNKLGQHVRELEQKREGAYEGLREQLRQLVQTHQQLQTTTANLVQALKSPVIRGKWGQYQLRRIVEMAGLTKHVDFEEQVGAGEGRPDMIIHLPNKGILPVDAKTPMQAYLEAMEATDDGIRTAKLKEHAKVMRDRVRELGQRHYWQHFERAPEFVVMFVPNDACLSAAFEHDQDLFSFAFEQRVLLVTPVTLLALLKAVAYGWQQQQIAENARQIAKQGKELYNRLTKFVEHLQETGRNLDAAVKAYNKAVGSLEGRLIPAARRFKELGAATEELPSLSSIEQQARLPATGEAQEEGPNDS